MLPISGVRPGEKLYEEVFFGHEAVTPTAYPKVLRSPADPGSDAKAGRCDGMVTLEAQLHRMLDGTDRCPAPGTLLAEGIDEVV